VVAIGVGVILTPSVATDKVQITPTAISQPRGFWYERSPRGFTFADVRLICIKEKGELPPKVPSQKLIWEIQYKNGRVREIDPGDLWEKNNDRIVEKLRGFRSKNSGL